MGYLIGDTAVYATWGKLRSVLANGETPAYSAYAFNVEYPTGLYPTAGKFLRAWNTPTTFFGMPGLAPYDFGGGIGWLLVGGADEKAVNQIIGETATFDTTETLTVTSDAFTGGQSFTPTVNPTYVESLGKFTRIV